MLGRTSVMYKELLSCFMPSKALPFMDLRGGRPVTVPRFEFGIKPVELRKAAVWNSVASQDSLPSQSPVW
jgi:hypothetical protein